MKNGYLIALLVVAALCAAVFGYYKFAKPVAGRTAQQDVSSPFTSSAKSHSADEIPGAKSSSLDPANAGSNEDPFITMAKNPAPATPATGSLSNAPATQPSKGESLSTTSAVPPVKVGMGPVVTIGGTAGSTTQPSGNAKSNVTGKHDTLVAAGSPGTYTVQKGDVLSIISQKTLGTAKLWKEIAKANPDVDADHLKVGQVLKIPAVGKPVESAKQTPSTPIPAIATPAAGTSTAAKTGKTAGNGASIVPVVDKAEKVTPALAAPAPASNGDSIHVVEAGETLSSIAREVYPHGGGTWKTLFTANKSLLGNDPNHLGAGMKLVVPAAKAAK